MTKGKYKLVKFEAEHLLEVDIQTQQEFIKNVLTVEYAEQFVNDKSFTLFYEDSIIFIGGMFEMWKGRAAVWSIFAKDSGRHFTYIVRSVKRFLNMNLIKYPRIECYVYINFVQAHRLVNILGFQYEGTLRKYNEDGSDAAMYSIIN